MMDAIDLEAARGRYPLPEGVEDVVVNRTELARGLDVSENTLTKWLARGMPCLQEGGNGRDYQFQLSDCYAWRMAVLEEDRAAKARAEAAAAQLALHFANDDETPEGEARLSPREIKEQAEAHIIRMKAAEMRGELVRVEAVRRTFEQMLDRVRRNMITLPDFCEREFGLTPDQVQALERRAYTVMTDMRRDIETMLAGGAVVDIGSAEHEPADHAGSGPT